MIGMVRKAEKPEVGAAQTSRAPLAPNHDRSSPESGREVLEAEQRSACRKLYVMHKATAYWLMHEVKLGGGRRRMVARHLVACRLVGRLRCRCALYCESRQSGGLPSRLFRSAALTASAGQLEVIGVGGRLSGS